MNKLSDYAMPYMIQVGWGRGGGMPRLGLGGAAGAACEAACAPAPPAAPAAFLNPRPASPSSRLTPIPPPPPNSLKTSPKPPKVIREYTGKVDLLMSERKEAKEAEKGAVDAMKQQQAAANSYAMLMPLALPAPGQGGGGPPPDGGFGGAPPPGYGAPPPGAYPGQY
jgi:hypothetical protein